MEKAVSESKDISSTSQAVTQDNPMMNDEVLTLLFERSRPEELNRNRLVCKHWYEVALPLWLKNGSTIVIKSNHENDNFIKFLYEAHLDPPMNHEDIVGIKQYRKFHLEHHDQEYSRLHFEVFWKECGNYLTHLTLNYFKIPDAVTFRDILFCKYTPNLEYLAADVKSIEGPTDPQLLNYRLQLPAKNLNLKTLMIDIADMHEDGVALGFGPFPLDWKSILNNLPNLKHFGVGRGISRVGLEVDKILTAIKEIRLEDKGNLDLKSLKWYFNQCSSCRPDGLKPSSISPLLLRQCQLRLEEFSFCFSREDASGELTEVVEDVLSIYSETLKKLEIYREVPFGRSPFLQIIMTQLHTLELTGYIIKDLTFLKKLPSLRSLRLWDDYNESSSPYPETFITATADNPDMEGITFPTISEFCCNYFCIWDPNDFTGLTRLMPNLSRLGIYLGDKEFRLVCQYFPQLEHLDLYDTDMGDEQILGFIMDGDHDPDSYGQANIARLRNLKSFALKVGVDDSFTRNSVIYGLLVLPCLEKLVIEVDVDVARRYYFSDRQRQSEMKEFILEKLSFAKVVTDRDYCLTCGQTANCN